MIRLPVRIEPVEGESLTSLLTRLAEANHMSPPRVSAAKISAADLTHLADLSGNTLPRLLQTTWLDYPAAITGSRGSTGWWLRRARWWCPNCAPFTNIWMRSWELACLPVCLNCHTKLTLHPDPTIATAGRNEVTAVVEIAALVSDSRQNPAARAKLGRLLRVARLIATTCTRDWPLGLSPEVTTQLRTWAHHPAADPGAVLSLLPLLLGQLNTRRERAMVSEAWARYRRGPRLIAMTLLPKPPRVRAVVPSPRPARPGTVDSARIKALAEGVTSLGLRPEHVPTIIPSRVGSFLPPEGTWPEDTELAVALVMLSTHSRTGEPIHISDAYRRLHLPHYRPSQALRELERGIVSNALADRILQGALSALQLGGVDYHHRRTLLTGLHELPILSGKPPVSAEARSWIWVYLTHGSIVWTGPAWAQLPALLPTREVMRFHHDIGLAARVTLATYADQLLEWLSADDMAAWDSQRDTVVARRIHAGT